MHELQNKGNKIFIIIIRPEQKNLRVEYTIENNIDIVIIRPPSYGINAKKGIGASINQQPCVTYSN